MQLTEHATLQLILSHFIMIISLKNVKHLHLNSFLVESFKRIWVMSLKKKLFRSLIKASWANFP